MFFVLRLKGELLKNINTDNILNAIHDRNSLQQAQMTHHDRINGSDVQCVHRANERPITVV